ncbi:MAG: iron ABC transporter permease [Turicibacter sp.]|nr:iron ABC transporter permease [Turicibacter sp.]
MPQKSTALSMDSSVNPTAKQKANWGGRGIWAATFLILAILVLLPLGMLFGRAIFHNGDFILMETIGKLMNPQNVQTIVNTLKLSVAVVAGSTLVALPLAYLTARTHFAKYKWLDIVLMIPFMTPPFISSMGWILFTQRRGLFQQMFPATGEWSEGFLSFFGLTMVMSFHLFPFMLTILKNALLNVSPSLEESAAIFGGKFWYRLRKVLLPLVTGSYAIGALLVFVKTASEYGTPATIGRRIGFNVFVTEIHRNATVAPLDFGTSAALSAVLIGICLMAWFLQNYIAVRRSYKLVGGKGSRQKFIDLKGWKLALAWVYVVALLAITVGVPYFSVVVTSLINLRGFGMAAGNFTFSHYINLFTANPRGIQALQNSLMLGVVSAILTTILGVLCATIIHRTKSKAINISGLLPDMLPSIVFVIGIMLFWNNVHHILPLYNTIWILIVAYVALFLPFTIQSVTSSYSQISDSLMASARVFGGRPFYIFRRITLPLLFRGILASWMMTFIIAFRELVTASIIAPPNTLVVATFIMREFEQGSVSVGMAMAVVNVVFTTTFLILINKFMLKERA